MELSCPAPKHCEYGRKMASAAWEAHETPRLSAKFSSYDPFKTARLNQAGRKNKLRHSCGVTATLATKNHKALYSLLRDQEVACSQTPSKICKLWWPGPGWPGPGGPVPLAGPGVPVARSRPGRVARSRWPGPVPVARSRWPGPAGPVPVARSRSRFKGACPQACAKKDLFCGGGRRDTMAALPLPCQCTGSRLAALAFLLVLIPVRVVVVLLQVDIAVGIAALGVAAALVLVIAIVAKIGDGCRGSDGNNSIFHLLCFFGGGVSRTCLDWHGPAKHAWGLGLLRDDSSSMQRHTKIISEVLKSDFFRMPIVLEQSPQLVFEAGSCCLGCWAASDKKTRPAAARFFLGRAVAEAAVVARVALAGKCCLQHHLVQVQR